MRVSRGLTASERAGRATARNRSRDTRPELALRSALWKAGVRGWRCHARILGRPDLVFSRWRLAVFADGVWWHGHPEYLPRGRSGRYWDAKIARNRQRDAKVTATLRAGGWAVLRMWDVDILRNPSAAATCVMDRLQRRGWRS